MRLPEIVENVPSQAARRFAVAGYDLQPLIVAAAQLFPLCVAKLLPAALDEEFCRLHIARGIEQNAVCSLAVASGTPRLLIIRFEALRHVVVDHEIHIGFIDAHAESVRRNDHVFPVELKIVLACAALAVLHSGVITDRGDAAAAQRPANALGGGARGAVNDACLVPPRPQKIEQRGHFVFRALHVKEEVRAVEARDAADGITQFKQTGNVLLHLRRGGRGERRHRRALRQRGNKVRYAPVAWTEVLPPLGDAVRLVHGHKRDRHRLHECGEALRFQPFRRDIQQLVYPLPRAAVHKTQLLGGERAVDVRGADPRVFERRHLILHQGDQRRYDDRNAAEKQRGNLVAQGFPAAGRHDAERIPAGQNGVDKFLLPLPETAVAEAVLQHLVFIHRPFLPLNVLP